MVQPYHITYGLQVGKTQGPGKIIKEILEFSASVNPPSIAANDGDKVAVTLTGVALGDYVITQAPDDLEAGLFPGQAWVSAADTVQLPLYNYTAGAVDGAAKTWK